MENTKTTRGGFYYAADFKEKGKKKNPYRIQHYLRAYRELSFKNAEDKAAVEALIGDERLECVGIQRVPETELSSEQFQPYMWDKGHTIPATLEERLLYARNRAFDALSAHYSPSSDAAEALERKREDPADLSLLGSNGALCDAINTIDDILRDIQIAK